MTRADVAGLMSIAAVAHPNYPETEAVFSERLFLFPAGCRALAGRGWAAATDMSSATLGGMRRLSR